MSTIVDIGFMRVFYFVYKKYLMSTVVDCFVVYLVFPPFIKSI